MLIADALDIKGNLTIQKIAVSARIIETIEAHNNIVTTGRDLVAKLFIKQDAATISYFAVGTGSNSVLPNDSQLNQEVFRKQLPELTSDNLEKITLNNGSERVKLSIKADLETGEANNYTLTEAALFTAAQENTNSIMYNRVIFSPINKTQDYKLTLVWEIIF